MLLVGLTGGIGSGKSTVAAMLAARGAAVIDADELARRAVEPSTPGFREVVEAFGDTVVGDDGRLDRRRLAEMVFGDPDQRRRLEAIVHPEVGRLFEAEVDRFRPSDRIVVYDVPLLVENRLEKLFDVVVVVVAPDEVRIRRAMAARGLSEEQARARLSAQATDRQRHAVADVVIDNTGSLEDLERRVDALWQDLTR